VLLPLLANAGGGPYAGRIAAAFAALAGADLDPVALARVRDALLRADARVALVDRMLAELGPDPEAARLVEARARAADEIEAVLRGVAQLRVQLGLVALAGDTAPARRAMAELAARVGALEELTTL
jgi:hypothetical protein